MDDSGAKYRLDDFVKLANLFLNEIHYHESRKQAAKGADATFLDRLIEEIQEVFQDAEQPIDPPDKQQRQKLRQASLWLKGGIKKIQSLPSVRMDISLSKEFEGLQKWIDRACNETK